MTSFREKRDQVEQKVMVNLLSEIEKNPSCTQRGLSQDLGIALGLMNQYVKRCVSKGWVRASQVSPRRMTYFLTPEGFLEKSQMVRDYLAGSLSFFRDAKGQCEEVFAFCETQGWQNIALVGAGDLAEIAHLVSQAMNIETTLVVDMGTLKEFDAVMITDVLNPQSIYDDLKKHLPKERLVVLDLLHISRGGAV